MTSYRFPEIKTIFSDKPFSREALAHVLGEIFRVSRLFTGYLRISVASGPSWYLFLLDDTPVAAGALPDGKAIPLAIAVAVQEITALPAGSATISLIETDHPLLHDIMMFFRDEPSAKAPVSLINLEQIVEQLRAEDGDGLVILEKGSDLNFFEYRYGEVLRSYMADPLWVRPADLSLEEQMLLCAFQSDPSLVMAHFYRIFEGVPRLDTEQVSREELLEMVQGVADSAGRKGKEAAPAAGKATVVAVTVTVGEESTLYYAPLPCSVGRQGCDIDVGDPLVSRRHLTLGEADGELFVEDLGSTNGTFLNGEQVSRATISEDDVITLGDTALRLTRPSA